MFKHTFVLNLNLENTYLFYIFGLQFYKMLSELLVTSLYDENVT